MTEFCDIFPLRDGDPTNVLGSINVEITSEGAVPAYDHGLCSGSVNPGHYTVNALETKAPTTGNPRLYWFAGRKEYWYQDGVIVTGAQFADVFQGALIFGAVAGGVVTKRLIAFFGDSTAGALAGGGHAWRNLAADAAVVTQAPGTGDSPWLYHVGATAIQGWLAKNFGPDAIVITGAVSAGRTVLTEWNASKVVQGLYDGTINNIGPAEPVGNGDWPAIALASVRNSFVIGTGAGAFMRNTVDKIWEPVRSLQEKLPHGMNTKGMSESENGVVYPMADGRLFEYASQREVEITPLRGISKPKDSQRGRVCFIADRGDVLAVGYEVAQAYTASYTAAAQGVRYFVRLGGNWSEITTGVTDGSYATPASPNMASFGANATDRLVAVSPFPLSCIIPYVTRAPNSVTNARFATPRGTAQGAAETAGALSVALGTVIDNTGLESPSVTGASLTLTGMPPAAAEPILGWDSISSYADVGPALTLTFAGGAGFTGVLNNVYAYEWSGSGTAMSAGTTIDELPCVSARPGLGLNDASGPFTRANDFSSLAMSGMLTEVYFGKRLGFGQYEWAVPYSIWTKGGGVRVAAWTTCAPGPASTAPGNGGQLLIGFGRFGQWQIAEGLTRDPRRTRYPRLCQWTPTEPGPTLAINDIVFRTTQGQLADPAKAKRITHWEFEGEDIQTADQIKPVVSYQRGRGWAQFPAAHGPSPVKTQSPPTRFPQGGPHARAKILISDGAQTDLWAPVIKRIRIGWEYVEDGADIPDPVVAIE